MPYHTNMNSHAGFGPAVPPELYGSVTVGERGQVVIPRAAREQMSIKAGDKLLAIGGIPGAQGLLLVKTEAFSTLISELSKKITEVSRLIDLGVAPPRRRPAPKTRRSRS